MKPAAFLATVFLALIALLHVVRLLYQVPVIAGSTEIPMWPSVFAVVGPAALAIWLWREQRQ